MSILNYATTLLPPPSLSLPPLFILILYFVLLRSAASAPFSFPPSPQERHRLRRPPLNQVSDYLLEIDFTCSARFCICTSALVRRTSAIVPDITGVSPSVPVRVRSFSSSSPAPSSSSSCLSRPHCCSPSADGIDLRDTGGLRSNFVAEFSSLRTLRLLPMQPRVPLEFSRLSRFLDCSRV